MLFIKKRVIAIVLAVCLLAVSVGLFSSCSRAPKEEDIYDRVVELIEASYPLNTVFYGAGLPTYAADSEYARITQMYYGFSQTEYYEMITPFSRYLSIDEIKESAEKVYSKEYLENVLYPSVFIGYAIEDGIGGSAFSRARYLEEETRFLQSTKKENYLTGVRLYDYSTIRVVAPSNAKACYVEVASWLENMPDLITTVRLRLVLQDDGLWYLDSFTG